MSDVEIERKFLLKNDGWKHLVTKSYSIKQGYISETDTTITRIRLVDDSHGTLTIKSKNPGLTRMEIQHELSLDLTRDCFKHSMKRFIDKVRHVVFYKHQCFEIDEFLGDNQGLVVAEIELKSEDQELHMPDWLGDEVTHEKSYYNDDLSKYPYKTWGKEMVDWDVVEKNLKERRPPMYYLGGTLSCSTGKDSFVGLNLNGGAFNEKDEKVQQPEHILKLTREIYLEAKGETDYYKSIVTP